RPRTQVWGNVSVKVAVPTAATAKRYVNVQRKRPITAIDRSRNKIGKNAGARWCINFVQDRLGVRICRECCDKGFLRNFDGTHHLHTLFTFLLLLEQLALTRNVTAITLGKHVFPDRTNVLSGNNARTDSSLDGNLKLLPRNKFLELCSHFHAVTICMITVGDDRERINGISLQQDVDFYQISNLGAVTLPIQRGITLGARFQEVEVVEHNLCQRDPVPNFNTLF